MKFEPSGSLDASMFERDDDLTVQNVLVQNVVNNYLDQEEGDEVDDEVDDELDD